MTDISSVILQLSECILGANKLFLDNDRDLEVVGDPVFPVEVTDMIIDHLHDCPYMLKWCSLVCRDWRASSRYHLFYTMSFSPERVAFSDLLAFIVSAPDVCPYITVFTLSDYRGLSLKDVRAVLEPLTGLRSVTLDRLHISKPQWREPAPEAAVRKLATLRISSCNIVELDTTLLLRLLGLFSEITALHLSHSMSSYSMHVPHGFGVFAHGRYRRVPDKFPLHFPINKLVLRGASLHALCIDGGCPSWEHVRKVGEFLTVVGPQLRDVSVRLTDRLVAPREGPLHAAHAQPPAGSEATNDTKDKWRALRLDKCTKLEVFKICVGPVEHFAQRDCKAVFRTTVDLLTHLPSSVTEVRIGFSTEWFYHHNNFEEYKEFLMGLDWQALDSTLAARRYKKLTVVLDVGLVKATYRLEHCRELFQCARRALPALDSRDMLKLDFTEEKWWVHNQWY